MIRNLIKTAFSQLGYVKCVAPEVSNIQSSHIVKEERQGFVLYKYIKPDGSFDYDRYRSIQEEGNKAKIDQIWVVEENIAFISRYLCKHISPLNFGICHGTRRGKEQEWFRKHLNCEVIGTEISSTAISFPNTIQWDFHETKSEWIERVDFIYSNSFDHSYEPEKCLNAWMSCIRKGGMCVLEHTSLHSPEGAAELDPFGADIVQMPYLIAKWAQGRYGVRQLLDAPVKRPDVRYNFLIIIQKF